MLEKYGKYLHRLWKANSVLDTNVQATLSDVKSCLLESEQLPNPYKEVAHLKKKGISHILKRLKTHVLAKFEHKYVYIKHILSLYDLSRYLCALSLVTKNKHST